MFPILFLVLFISFIAYLMDAEGDPVKEGQASVVLGIIGLIVIGFIFFVVISDMLGF